MTGICKFCGKEIRRSREGFWGARAQDEPALWHCADDPSNDKRHAPAAQSDELDYSELHAHVKAMHSRVPLRRSNVELSWAHARDHHHFGSRDHRHAGANVGADDRPPGWCTGKDVVTRGQDEAAQRSRLAERAEPGQDFIVTVTNGSGRKEMEIRASGQSVAFNYAARVCEHEGAGFYPAEVRPKDGTS